MLKQLTQRFQYFQIIILKSSFIKKKNKTNNQSNKKISSKIKKIIYILISLKPKNTKSYQNKMIFQSMSNLNKRS